MSKRIFLFGEAEKGERVTVIQHRGLEDLLDKLGEPPPYSRGIFYAIEALNYHKEVIFYRVEQEGFGMEDYAGGMHLLHSQGIGMDLSAISLPGMGDPTVIAEMGKICRKIRALLLSSPDDLYDYLTAFR